MPANIEDVTTLKKTIESLKKENLEYVNLIDIEKQKINHLVETVENNNSNNERQSLLY